MKHIIDSKINFTLILFRDALITYMSMTNIKQQSDVEKR